MKLLTVLMGEALGSAVIEKDKFQPKLLAAFTAATKLGGCLLYHPAEFRFDWRTTNHPSTTDNVTEFPWLYRESDKTGRPELRPVLIEAGSVKCMIKKGSP